jgi:hypothetical protein
MATTRSKTQRKHSKLSIYRQRVKSSHCRKIKRSLVCKRSSTCKYASGKKRRFCRKSRNTRA